MPRSGLPSGKDGPDQGCANDTVPFDGGPRHVVLIGPGIPWAGLAEVEMAKEGTLALPTRCPNRDEMLEHLRHNSFPLDQSRSTRAEMVGVGDRDGWRKGLWV